MSSEQGDHSSGYRDGPVIAAFAGYSLRTSLPLRHPGQKEMNVYLPDGRVIDADVASTPEALQRGLAGRTLQPNQGMLFIHPVSDNYSYWMLGMLIPIDVIWLDSDKRIVSIWRNAQLCSDPSTCPRVSPAMPAKYVLEVGALMSRSLRIGQKLAW